jgi:group II intron reverse transcriptase/maturase
MNTMRRTGTESSMRAGDSENQAEKAKTSETGGVGNTERRGNGSQTRTAHDEEAGDGTTNLMEEVLRRENLMEAYKRVKRNRGAAGVDGMTVEELMPYCQAHWDEIREQLLNGSYMPSPVKKVEIPKPNGKGTRMLGIPTVLDRMIQQAVQQVLTPIYDPMFSESSFGFRPGRSAHQAIRQAKKYVTEGYDWEVSIDLSKFFDRVNHDVLMSRMARVVKDKRLLRLIRKYLQAGMMEGGIVSPRIKGTPQGGPLSPLTSNILLDELDKEIESRGHRFCRYADDVTIYVKSEAAGKRVMETLTKFLEKRLRLRVNREKSAVARPWERSFLGYSFTDEKETRIRIPRESVKKLKKKLKPLWKRGKGQSLKSTIYQLNRIIVGWTAYFRMAEVDWNLRTLDSWIRHRLRCIIWRHWKRPKTRMKNLQKLGVPAHIATSAAYAEVGPWKASTLHAVHTALPNRKFSQMGLKSLLDEYRRFASLS